MDWFGALIEQENTRMRTEANVRQRTQLQSNHLSQARDDRARSRQANYDRMFIKQRDEYKERLSLGNFNVKKNLDLELLTIQRNMHLLNREKGILSERDTQHRYQDLITSAAAAGLTVSGNRMGYYNAPSVKLPQSVKNRNRALQNALTQLSHKYQSYGLSMPGYPPGF